MQVQIKSFAAAIPVVTYFLPISSNALTYPLVHGNIFHLVANVIVLYLFLRSALDMKTWVNYLIGGYIASVLAYLLYDNSMVVGASGFVYGIIGVYTAFAYRGLFVWKLYLSLFALSMILSLAVGFIVPGLAGLLHVYALVVGVVYGLIAIRINRFANNFMAKHGN